MKATISMSRNSLWKMIQAMSLNADNKLWLGEELIEAARKEVAETAPCRYSVEELEYRRRDPLNCQFRRRFRPVPLRQCSRRDFRFPVCRGQIE